MEIKCKKSKKFKLKISSIIAFLLILNSFNISVINSNYSNRFHLVIESVCLFYTFFHGKISKNNRILYFWVFLFCTGIMISTYLGTDGYINGAFQYSFQIITFFLTSNCIIGKNKEGFINSGLLASFITVFINDFLMLSFPSRFYGKNDSYYIGTFLLGNKFNVAYAHFLLLIFIELHLKKDNSYYYKSSLALFALLFISFYIKCTTMVIGAIFLLIFSFFHNSFEKVFLTKKAIILIFAISGLFPILFSTILNFQSIQNIVINVFHKSLTLSGRTNVYDILPFVFKEKKLFGYGIDSTIIRKVTWDGWHGYGNAQNGLWDVLINYGLNGVYIFTVIYCTILLRSLNFMHKNKAVSQNIKILVIGIEALMIISTVEIIYRSLFFMMLAMLNAFFNEYERNLKCQIV